MEKALTGATLSKPAVKRIKKTAHKKSSTDTPSPEGWASLQPFSKGEVLPHLRFVDALCD